MPVSGRAAIGARQTSDRSRHRIQPLFSDRVATVYATPVRPGFEAIQRSLDGGQFVASVLIERVERLVVLPLARLVREVGIERNLASAPIVLNCFEPVIPSGACVEELGPSLFEPV